MHDIQNSHDDRGITIDHVGITGLRYAITFTDGIVCQAGIASIEITVELQHNRRGTHVSRMIELVQDHLTELDPRALPVMLKAAAHYLDAPTVTVAASIPIGIDIYSPITKLVASQVHDLTISGTLTTDEVTVNTSVTSDITTLCPCSKAISDYGAHNQRSKVTLTVTGRGDAPYPLPVSQIIDLIRTAGSAPVYPIIKRPDERHITMQAFDKPAFVEDIAREISTACRQLGLHHCVNVQSIESIHSHDAIARITV